jgi:hypothetical protein
VAGKWWWRASGGGGQVVADVSCPVLGAASLQISELLGISCRRRRFPTHTTSNAANISLEILSVRSCKDAKSERDSHVRSALCLLHASRYVPPAVSCVGGALTTFPALYGVLPQFQPPYWAARRTPGIISATGLVGAAQGVIRGILTCKMTRWGVFFCCKSSAG